MPDSTAVGTVHKGDRPLTTIDQWHRFARPKRDIHWKDGRSAKENARAWLDAAPSLQPDVAQTLGACRDIGPLRQWCAEPEARVPIDTFRGEQPNIDLLLVAEDNHGPVVIAIEAKADETFGNELADQYRRARAARASNPRSKTVDRIEALLDRFALAIDQRRVPELRYQLLTATAAVLAEASRYSSQRAVLIVHEFVTPLTLPERREHNAADLDRFLLTAFDREGHLSSGDVTGPILVQGAPTLYVGKARTVV
jgi:hypothetical protein